MIIIDIEKTGVHIKIDETFNARQLWDLDRHITNALWEYKRMVGKEQFNKEMAFDPEKKA